MTQRLSRWVESQVGWLVVAAVVGGWFVPTLPSGPTLVLSALFLLVFGAVVTVDLDAFRAVRPPVVGRVTALGLLAPLCAWLMGHLLGLPLGLLLGLVLFFAAPPELSTPLLVRLSRGNVALASVLLLVGAMVSLFVLPLFAVAVAGAVTPIGVVVRAVLVGVLLPILCAVVFRLVAAETADRHAARFGALSATTLVLLMFLVTQDARGFVLEAPPILLRAVGAGALLLVVMAALGVLAARGRDRASAASDSAGGFALGVRDFAVAAAVLLAIDAPSGGTAVTAVLGLLELAAAAVVATRLAAAHP